MSSSLVALFPQKSELDYREVCISFVKRDTAVIGFIEIVQTDSLIALLLLLYIC